jgi:hypothetical protein
MSPTEREYDIGEATNKNNHQVDDRRNNCHCHPSNLEVKTKDESFVLRIF